MARIYTRQEMTDAGKVVRAQTSQAIEDYSQVVSQLLAERITTEKRLKALLNYVGGWDLEDPTHPIVKARKHLEALQK